VVAVVPARCAVRMPGSLKMSDLAAGLSRDAVAMRCTKGTLPVGGASPAGAAGPRGSRDLVTPTSPAPRPLAQGARCPLARPRAVRDPAAAIGPAGQAEAGQPRHRLLDGFRASTMADVVLRHRPRIAHDPGETRLPRRAPQG